MGDVCKRESAARFDARGYAETSASGGELELNKRRNG